MKQADKKGTDAVKKGKTKGIFDVEKDDTLEKQIFKQDEDLSKLLEKKIELRDKQLKRLDKELLGLDLNDEEEKLPSKKTLDDANQELKEFQDELFAESMTCIRIITGKEDIFDEWIEQGLADVAFDVTQLEIDLEKEGSAVSDTAVQISGHVL